MATAIRGILGTLALIAGLMIGAACTPAAELTPVKAPVEPAPKAAKAAATSDVEWKVEWDRVVAAAKKEGKVVVAGAPGDTYRQAAMEFQKAYPDITLEFTGISGRDAGPKLVAERKAGLYLWDVYMGGAGTVLRVLMPDNVMAPVRPTMILPEVLDDSKWLGGFEEGWMDLTEQYIYSFLGYASFGVRVNRDIVPKSELNSIEQLVDPKWKGKIGWQDPRVSGSGGQYADHLYDVGREDLLRKLLAQDIVPLTDIRMLAEGLVRGRYPIAIGVGGADLRELEQVGLTANIEILDPDSVAGSYVSGGFGHVALIDNAPNPNAAKVFINWLLSKKGQEAQVRHTNLNSRRIDLDVDGPPETAPKPGTVTRCRQYEPKYESREHVEKIAKDIIK